MSRDVAVRHANEIQEHLLEHLRALDKKGGNWALLGGRTEDDGTTLRLTMYLETRYATSEPAPAPGGPA